MEFSSNPNTNCTENPQSFISTLLFSDSPSQKYLNPQVRTNKLIKCFYHPSTSHLTLSFKIIHRNTWFYISLNSLGFYLSRDAGRIFYDLHIPTWVGKIFQCMMFTFLQNALNLCMFTHAPVPHSKLQVEVFENYFPPRQKGWRKLWFAQ